MGKSLASKMFTVVVAITFALPPCSSHQSPRNPRSNEHRAFRPQNLAGPPKTQRVCLIAPNEFSGVTCRCQGIALQISAMPEEERPGLNGCQNWVFQLILLTRTF